MLQRTKLSFFCDVCDKPIDFESKSKHIIYKSHIYKEKFGVVVKDYEFFKPNIFDVNYILNYTNKDCRNRYFHTFENRCLYHIKFRIITFNEEVFLSVTLEFVKYNSQFY